MTENKYSTTRLKPVIRDYGCRNRLPHDLFTEFEDKTIKVQRCKICNKQLRFNLGWQGRLNNYAYLEANARKFAQPHGRTKRLYYKIYKPDELIIKL